MNRQSTSQNNDSDSVILREVNYIVLRSEDAADNGIIYEVNQNVVTATKSLSQHGGFLDVFSTMKTILF